MINFIGYNGAAVATVLVIYMWTVSYNLFFIKKILNIKYSHILPYRKLVNILLVSILATLILLPKFALNLPNFLGLVSFGILYFSTISLLYWCNNWIYIQKTNIRWGKI